jgi:hypothetical protein
METKFVQACKRGGMASHDLWIRCYERIEAAISFSPMREHDIERAARIYPLGPTLRQMKRLGLIEEMPGTYAVKGPFYNPMWRLARGSICES